MKKLPDKDSNCIDVGMLDGEILDKFQYFALKGHHFGFEPIPKKFEKLQHKYQSKNNVTIHNVALSDQNGETEFNYVTSNPSYSGIRKRSYDRLWEKDTNIKVDTRKLDSYIEHLPKIDMVKIDVERAEYLVFNGARQVILNGIGGADIIPGKMYDLLANLNYTIYLLQDWLKNQFLLSRDEFIRQFNESLNYFFVAIEE